MRCILALVIILALCGTTLAPTLVAGPAQATGGAQNCGTTSSPSHDEASAPIVTIPMKCVGTSSGPTDDDFYAFTLTAGQHVFVNLAGGSTLGADVEFIDGAEPSLVCQLFAGTQAQCSFVADHSGTFDIRVGGGAYEFEVALAKTSFSGRMLATEIGPVPHHGVTGLSGPLPTDAAGVTIDGAWVDLPATADGHEFLNGGVHAYFYDAAGTELGGCSGGDAWTGSSCTASPGAVRMLIEVPTLGGSWSADYYS